MEEYRPLSEDALCPILEGGAVDEVVDVFLREALSAAARQLLINMCWVSEPDADL